MADREGAQKSLTRDEILAANEQRELRDLEKAQKEIRDLDLRGMKMGEVRRLRESGELDDETYLKALKNLDSFKKLEKSVASLNLDGLRENIETLAGNWSSIGEQMRTALETRIEPSTFELPDPSRFELDPEILEGIEPIGVPLNRAAEAAERTADGLVALSNAVEAVSEENRQIREEQTRLREQLETHHVEKRSWSSAATRTALLIAFVGWALLVWTWLLKS